jgi:hypothetical protein
LAALACFAFYLLYLLLELVCEIDASRRAVRELLRHGFLQESESRVARRILCAALGTYLAAFGGTALALTLFLPQVDWLDLLGGHPQSPLAAPPSRQSLVAEQGLAAKTAWRPVPVRFDYRGLQSRRQETQETLNASDALSHATVARPKKDNSHLLAWQSHHATGTSLDILRPSWAARTPMMSEAGRDCLSSSVIVCM